MPAEKRKQAVSKQTATRVPRWLKWVPRAGLFFSAVAALAWAVTTLSEPTTLPVNKVRVQGDFTYLNETMLREALGERIQAGYFNVDVIELRERITRLAWVDTAAVRRVWPDTIVIRVIEQQPRARWQRGGLVNVRGEVFQPRAESYPKDLPVFVGTDGEAHIVADWFSRINQQLDILGRRVQRIELSRRGALGVQLDDGTELLLGRDHIDERLTRFTQVYQRSLATYSRNIARVDLRYTNGVAVRWKNGRPGVSKMLGQKNSQQVVPHG